MTRHGPRRSWRAIMGIDGIEDRWHDGPGRGGWGRWTGPLAVAVLSALTVALLVVTGVVTLGPSPAAPAPLPSQTRTYYIGADHVAWDYAPDGPTTSAGSRGTTPRASSPHRVRTGSARCTPSRSTASTPTPASAGSSRARPSGSTSASWAR